MATNLDNTLYFLTREQEEQHAQERAKQAGISYINLAKYPIVKEVLSIMTEEEILEHMAVPYLRLSKNIKVGVVNPDSVELNEFLQKKAAELNVEFEKVLISKTSLSVAVLQYEELKKLQKNTGAAPVALPTDQKVDVKDIQAAADAARSASLTKLLDTLLIGAISLGSSDIHLEPAENGFLTRYRIDGVLQDVVTLPLSNYKALVSRIKYMSSLRMDTMDKPQDGRFTFQIPGDGLMDFRVAIMPSSYGESIVLRLLGREHSIVGLDQVGFRPDVLAAIKEAVSKPHGMILTSGPTGSGKSTTLYSILIYLKKPGVKIITMEDPVEYKIEGVEQSQVRPGLGYEFAEGLRAALRQDPDILMVGEIRDLDTAEIAIQSALTGHLLLSTIHANSAPAVFARLLEIGIKPFLLSGSVNLIMAQRLLRKICPNCRETYTLDAGTWQQITATLASIKDRLPQSVADKIKNNDTTVTRGKGCPKCSQTGFAGRQIIAEYMLPNEEIEKLLAVGATIHEFEKTAVATGMITMEQDGLILALQGVTTIDEVWRVTKS